MENIVNWLVTDYLGGLLDSFIDPKKRVSVIYLISAIIIAVCWSIFVSKKDKTQALHHIKRDLFSKEIWFSISVRADLLLLLTNRAIMLLISPMLLSRVAATTGLFYFLSDYFESGQGALIGSPYWLAPVSYTLFLFVFDDFSRFLIHKALHQIPVLWAFHKIHHSAEFLTPFTVYRTHPLEGILFTLRSIIVQAITISLFVYLFGGKIDLISIYSVNFLLFIFNVTGANLRHSHFNISYGAFLEKILISPAQHQIHHSTAEKHRDKNFGAILAIWDLLGTSLCLSYPNQNIKFGIKNAENLNLHKLSTMYLQPFVEMNHYIASIRTKIRQRNSILSKKVSTTTKIARSLVLISILIPGVLSYSSNLSAETINIYSHRQPFLINPFLTAFEKESGIKTNVIYSTKGLAQRMLAEGKRSPADIVLTVDISRLSVYADKNLLAPIKSKILFKNIPRHIRDKKNRWFGFSKRARILAVATNRVEPRQLENIEDLANPTWRGRICSRPGSHVYNRALLASIIAANGEHAAEEWARGLVKNLAQRPQGNDRAQVKAIFQGMCDVAIINSYYFGKLRNSKIPEQRAWTKNVRIVFTNQNGRGNHINISGGGVAKHSRKKDLAIKFLEFLSEEKAQKLFSKINYEFPGNSAIKYSDELISWGSFNEDKLAIEKIAELAPKAQRIIDRVGW
ncbi:MAG: extracellular solute-binding protein [Pseudomonadota bacterium]|nr:extracellular solute-binding protein [Pseudomonadota bacterium]